MTIDNITDISMNYDFCTGVWFMNGQLNSNHLSLYDFLIRNVTVQISYTPAMNLTNSTASNVTTTNSTVGWAATIYGETSYQQMNISAGFQYKNDALGKPTITACIPPTSPSRFIFFDISHT